MWLEQRIRIARRYVVIWNVFLSYALRLVLNKLWGGAAPVISPQEIREVLESLGGSFLKFGQLAAVRPDYFPEEYCREFLKLLDEAPPIPSAYISWIFLREFGRYPEEIFALFNREPLAAASFGQVHEAVLHEGERVAVKIQRPFVEDDFAADARFFSFLGWLLSKSGISKALDPSRAVREFITWTWRELDYRREAEHLLRLRDIAERNKFDITIPNVFFDYSTPRILTMEFLEGRSLKSYYSRRESFNDAHEFFRALTFFELYSFLFEGFFHADPHPANIFVLSNGAPGLIDAGLVAHIAVSDRKRMGRFFKAVVKNDLEESLKMFIEMVRTPALEILNEAKEKYPQHWLKIQFLKSIFVGKLKNGIKDLMERWHKASGEGGSLQDRSPIHKMLELVELAEKAGIRMPDSSVIFIRTFFSIDIAVLEIEPGFNIPESVKEFFEAYDHKFRALEEEPDEVPPYLLPEANGEWAREMKEREAEIKAAEHELIIERTSAIMDALE